MVVELCTVELMVETTWITANMDFAAMTSESRIEGKKIS